jgi:hypothetical protein
MAGRLARITESGRGGSGPPPGEDGTGGDREGTAPDDAARRTWRRDHALWIPLGALLLTAVAVAVLVITGSGGGDDAGGTTTSTARNGFSIETDGGSLTFDQDDDRASVAFQGPDQEGQFSFDLDGDGVVTAGEGGSFELDGGTPPGWPRAFPTPDDISVVRGSVLDAGELVQLSTTYRTTQPADDVVDFYVDALADAHPLVEEPGPEDPPGATTISFEGRWTGFISVSESADGTVVAVQLFSEPVPAAGD